MSKFLTNDLKNKIKEAIDNSLVLINPEIFIYPYNLSIYSENVFISDDGIKRACREEFAHYFSRKSEYFYYRTHDANAINSIIKEVANLEYVLNIVKNRIVFQKTNKQNVIKINLSKWWTNNPLRRQFLTAFIKSCVIDNYFSIKSPSYSDYFSSGACNDAYYKFLSGKTFLEKKTYKGGWVNTFSNQTSLNKMIDKSCYIVAPAAEKID